MELGFQEARAGPHHQQPQWAPAVHCQRRCRPGSRGPRGRIQLPDRVNIKQVLPNMSCQNPLSSNTVQADEIPADGEGEADGLRQHLWAAPRHHRRPHHLQCGNPWEEHWAVARASREVDWCNVFEHFLTLLNPGGRTRRDLRWRQSRRWLRCRVRRWRSWQRGLRTTTWGRERREQNIKACGERQPLSFDSRWKRKLAVRVADWIISCSFQLSVLGSTPSIAVHHMNISQLQT